MRTNRCSRRHTRAGAACAAGLLLLGAVPVLAQQQAGGVVEGIVRSTDGGSPLVGAQVTAPQPHEAAIDAKQAIGEGAGKVPADIAGLKIEFGSHP